MGQRRSPAHQQPKPPAWPALLLSWPASWTLVACLLLVCAGCGKTRDDLGLVEGHVTLDGQPLADALVQFVPQGGKGVVSTGRTDSDGNYYMMASRTAKGASLGKNRVRITTYEILDEGGKQVPVPERVPTKYNSQTELSATVEPGDNTFNFDLSTAGGKVEQAKQTPLTQ
jgi:hypothetical protein